MKKPATKVPKLQPVTEAELKALAFVLPWIKVRVSKADGGIVDAVPIRPELRDRLIATIREQRATIRRLLK